MHLNPPNFTKSSMSRSAENVANTLSEDHFPTNCKSIGKIHTVNLRYFVFASTYVHRERNETTPCKQLIESFHVKFFPPWNNNDSLVR